MKTVLFYIAITILVLGLMFGGMCAEAWILMVAWNGLIAPWLGWPVLTFWVSFAILFVINLLFGGGVRVSSGK